MSPESPPVPDTSVGLGYGIAIALSILVLISTIMLASYACVRMKAGGNRNISDSTGESGYGIQTQSTRNSQEPMTILMGLGLGLDKPMIDSYPEIVLGESKRLPGPNNSPCSICLCDYSEKDRIKMIPGCNHCFHVDCVDDWLRISGTCPVCRNSPSCTPLATPLSELVPLAFNQR